MKTTELGTKTFATRASATATLKKLGIQKDEYDRFIIKKGAKFYVDVQLAERHIKQLEDAVLAKQTPATPPNRLQELAERGRAKAAEAAAAGVTAGAKPASKPKEPRLTVSRVARELILAGLSNEDVFKQLQAQFKLGDNKKSYPAWYRADLARHGKLKPAAK
jgi:DNA-binding MarR family transcriptional regulator